jgi:DNA-binding NarL/FixJ family response regulator
MGSSHRWLSLMDAFQNAAIESSGWYPALQGLADATGSRCGQLLGLSAGESACVIAAARRVTVGTVRAQLKASMAKLGVKRQAALVAGLGQLRS